MFRVIAVSVATIAIAYSAWANSATALYGKFAPEKALQRAPHSAIALINVTERASAQKDGKKFLRVARVNTIQALRSEPLAEEALRLLGLYYGRTGNDAKARQLVAMSSILSRRDSTTQLWLAADGLKNKKPVTTLTALDIVLRTQPDTREPIFQSLGTLLSNPQFRQIFVQYTRKQPPWLKQFVEYNISTQQQPEALSLALLEMKPFPTNILDDQAAGSFLSVLVNQAPIERARDLYEKMPGADRKALTSLSFSTPEGAFSFPPFGWELLSDSNVQGFGEIKGDSVTIEALAMPGRRGVAARKLLFLTPGNYRWTGVANLSEMRDRATASINLLCNEGPRKWARSSSKNLAAGTNNMDFSVGTGCAAQLLTIETVGSESQSDASLAVSEMRLVRSQRRTTTDGKK